MTAQHPEPPIGWESAIMDGVSAGHHHFPTGHLEGRYLMANPKTVLAQEDGPLPLIPEIKPSLPYPVSALGPLREAVIAVRDITKAPIALVAQSALSVGSLAVQAHGNVQMLGGGTAPLSLYCLTIAKSGERKSSSDKLLMKGVKEFEEKEQYEYDTAHREWRRANQIFEKREKELISKAAGKEKNKALEAEVDLAALKEPEAPLRPEVLPSDPTFEGLVLLFSTGRPSLGLFNDEGGVFVGGYSMGSDHKLKTMAGLSKLWDGEPINRTRSGDGATTLRGRRLALHLMVQPVVATDLLSDELASGQGFLPRMLIAFPPSTMGTRLYREASERAWQDLGRFIGQSKMLLEHVPSVSKKDRQKLEPRTLFLSDDARSLLIEYHDHIERSQSPGADYELVTAYASKSAEQAARIAGVMTLFENIEAETVSAEVIANAIALAQFYLSEIKRTA